MKLLVVEDDRRIAAAVARGLTAEGFTVEVVHDGDEGLWRATEGSYDLVLLDIMLPGRTATGLRRAARAGDLDADPDAHRQVGDLDEAEGLDTGADDYLTKPFSFPVLSPGYGP